VRHPTTPPGFFDFLNDFVRQNYALVGGYVNSDVQKGWVDQLTGKEFGDSTLLLYQLKY
jgi:hypothetical protein